MTLAYALRGNHIICYQLKRESPPVKLRLWEPPAPSSDPDVPSLPYLYAINFTFSTLAEAEAFLRNHLLANGAFDVPETDFPQEGQVEILPFPTWGKDDA